MNFNSPFLDNPMPDYRRNYVPGGTYSFTVVTHRRRRFLTSELARTCLHEEHGLRGVWQKRFWEHTIDDEDNLQRCVDYVHWNPKKHGFVSNVKDWPWSSFHRFVAAGGYTLDWGRDDPAPGFDAAEWE